MSLALYTATLSQCTGIVVHLANWRSPPKSRSMAAASPTAAAVKAAVRRARPAVAATGCGTGGSAVDLRPYFAHLRDQMEASQRVPLN